jgi:cold shock CspA family protein
MNDVIIEAYLKEFIEKYNLGDLKDSEAFEQFVNYCILSRLNVGEFNFDDVNVGGGNDGAIDGLAIIVNDHIVSSIKDIEFFKDTLKRFEIQFIFIQAKNSNRFNLGDIGNFLFGARNFFEKESSIKFNGDIEELKKMQQYIYSLSGDMDVRPSCQMYYVTTGKWLDDKTLLGRINSDKQLLNSMNIFEEVNFFPVDLEKLRGYYKELKNKSEKEFIFEKKTTLPKIDNVKESYLGIVPCEEYLKLICDADGNLQRNLFYDNIRDFQGDNPVNKEINETINNQIQNDKFVLLNNGITIVAKSLNIVGDAFKIKGYQVVNGCQTSHLLFRNEGKINNKMYLPLKLIIADDIEVTNLITKATNRQTEVKSEAFYSLSKFHKTLEDFYATFDKDKKLYYERRSKQYDFLPIRENQIVTMSAQIRSFVSMFLEEPHSTHRYYGELLKANESKLFLDSHSPFPYYISSYTLYTLENLFKSNRIDRFYKKFRYHMALLFRIRVAGSDIPPLMNSKKIDPYCIKIQDVLLDENTAFSEFIKTTEMIQSVLRKYDYTPKEATRRRNITIDLINLTKIKRDFTHKPSRQIGDVDWFEDIRGYGVIKNDTGDEFFVHYSAIRGKGYRSLIKGQKVEFSIIKNGGRFDALDVEIRK